MKIKDFLDKSMDKAGKLTAEVAETAKKVATGGVIPYVADKIMTKEETKTKPSLKSKYHKESKTSKIIKGVSNVSPVGRFLVDAYEETEKFKEINSAKNDINKAVNRAKILNIKTQMDLEKLGKLKAEILASFSEFSNCIEKFQERPEFASIQCNGVDLPTFTLKELETTSLDAKEIIKKVIKKQFSWASIAMVGKISILSTLAITAFPVFSLSLVASKFFFKKDSSEAEIWTEIENNKSQVESIIQRLSDVDNAILDYYNMMNRVHGYYTTYIDKIRCIVNKYTKPNSKKKILWSILDAKEQLEIKNCTLFVGLLYEMCKIQIIRVNKQSNKFTICHSDKNEMINKAEKIISTAA